MIPAAFEYHAPTTIAEATALLTKLGENAKVLSGGQSLIPLMKLRLANPAHVVDINGIPGLSGIREGDGFLRIGALTRESELEESELVRSRYPLLHDTSKVIADPLVRNLATVGGNLAHGDPAKDHPATMLALGAEVVAVGPKGERRLPIASFFTGPFETGLNAGRTSACSGRGCAAPLIRRVSRPISLSVRRQRARASLCRQRHRGSARRSRHAPIDAALVALEARASVLCSRHVEATP